MNGQCAVPLCHAKPERYHRLCLRHELDQDTADIPVEPVQRGRPPNRAPSTSLSETPASRESQEVAVLTLREAEAIRKALLDWSDDAVLRRDDGDLGRAYRVLSRQIEWITHKFPIGRNGTGTAA